MAISIKYQQLFFEEDGVKQMRWEIVLHFLSVRTFKPIDMVYKEGNDRTLLRKIQVTAVYWTGIITKLWYCFGIENDTTL
jgi:hypothetical protein